MLTVTPRLRQLSTRSVVLGGLAALVLLRILLCMAAPTQLHHSEEFVNLRLAASLLGDEAEWEPLGAVSPTYDRHPARPGLFDFQYQDWDGGTLVVALVLVPIAALGGLSVGTVKAGAILWSFGVALAWLLLLGRLWGHEGKRWAALAFAAVPVPYLLASSIHWGNHAESALFLPLVLLLLFGASEQRRTTPLLGRVAIAGLIAGFGVYFSLLNLLPLGAVLLVLPLFFGRRAVMAAPTFAASGLLGALPWLGRNSLDSLKNLGAQGVGVAEFLSAAGGAAQPAPKRWVHGDWPHFGRWDLHGLWAPDGFFATALDEGTRWTILALGAVALGCTLIAARLGPLQRKRLGVVGVLAVTYMLLPILLDRSWQLADRRLAPLYPIGSVLMVVGVLSLPDRLGIKRAGTFVLGVVLLSNLGAGLALIGSAERPTADLHPWTHFALPKPAVHLRTEVGIGDLAAAEVEDFNTRYGRLLSGSSSGGEEELRGLRRALAPSSGAIGVLHRPAPACPSEAILERAPPSQISSLGEARGFGEGLALRCPDDRTRAVAICGLLSSDELRGPCLSSLTANP
jgi:hypothetical protein